MADDKKQIRHEICDRSADVLDKVQKMFNAGEMTLSQMSIVSDILKDLASVQKSLAKAHHYECKSGDDDEKTW